jgi:hypothetical protein
MTCFTVDLDENIGENVFSNSSSLTVYQLDTPSLHVRSAGKWLDQPSSGGGVMGGMAAIRDAQEHADPPAALGGKL